MLLFRFESKTSVKCHNVNTQNVKIARRDRHLAPHRCETFENFLHIDIAPVRRTLSGSLHSKNWTMIFIGINMYMAPCSVQEKCVRLAEPCITDSYINSVHANSCWICSPIYKISKSRESDYIFQSCLVSAFDISVQLMFTRSQSTIFRAVHSMHFITLSLG